MFVDLVGCCLPREPAPKKDDVRQAPSCSICSRQRRISDARNRRWPPRVRMAVIFPARAQRVTVFGFTRKRAATSAGVKSASGGGVSAIVVRLPFGLSELSMNVRQRTFAVDGPFGSFFGVAITSYLG